ncbi:MAG: hypothetical protein QM796_08455 [Chthoniobacteraceae bacterium]
MIRYFASLGRSRQILWCYLVWYVTMVTLYFDPSPMLWLTSLGISAIIGFALLLSTTTPTHRPGGWTVFRLFLMPFCVSSYSALVKGKGFILLFPPHAAQLGLALGACAGFGLFQRICRLVAAKN